MVNMKHWAVRENNSYSAALYREYSLYVELTFQGISLAAVILLETRTSLNYASEAFVCKTNSHQSITTAFHVLIAMPPSAVNISVLVLKKMKTEALASSDLLKITAKL